MTATEPIYPSNTGNINRDLLSLTESGGSAVVDSAVFMLRTHRRQIFCLKMNRSDYLTSYITTLNS